MSTGRREKESVRLFVLMGMGARYSRDILRGVTLYESPRRTFLVEWGNGTGREYIIEEGLGAVISVYLDDASQTKALRCPYPVVNVSNKAPTVIVPRVLCDDGEIGRLAAGHLMSTGLRRFAVCASESTKNSPRINAFRDCIVERGFDCAWIECKTKERYAALASLPKPIGVMAYNDHVARKLALVCRESGLAIPGDVAIVGVGDDETLCSVIRPYLSSVDVSADRIGYEAARLIDRMLSGYRPPAQVFQLPPRGVVVRESSDFVAVDNERLAKAMQAVRDRVAGGVTVSQIASEVRTSRRTIQRLFSDHFGGSLKDHINRLRYENVQYILRETDRKIQDIAQSAGFRNYVRFNANFRKRFGKTPGQYRNQFRVR